MNGARKRLSRPPIWPSVLRQNLATRSIASRIRGGVGTGTSALVLAGAEVGGVRAGTGEDDRVRTDELEVGAVVPAAAQVGTVEVVRGVARPLGDELAVALVEMNVHELPVGLVVVDAVEARAPVVVGEEEPVLGRPSSPPRAPRARSRRSAPPAPAVPCARARPRRRWPSGPGRAAASRRRRSRRSGGDEAAARSRPPEAGAEGWACFRRSRARSASARALSSIPSGGTKRR